MIERSRLLDFTKKLLKKFMGGGKNKAAPKRGTLTWVRNTLVGGHDLNMRVRDHCEKGKCRSWGEKGGARQGELGVMGR